MHVWRTRSLQRLAPQSRTPLGDLFNGENGRPARRRPRDSKDVDDVEEAVVEVQRISLVSGVAPPIAQKRSRHGILRVPQGLASHSRDRIPVCRCSECPGNGIERLYRRGTELNPEYALLLNMVGYFVDT